MGFLIDAVSGGRDSGHVYLAKTLATGRKVVIKQIDLSHQPRKALMMNELLAMKESQHPSIVTFLESYLVKNELWLVMEYMEGGALTDIIKHNELEEDQISSICFEVRVPTVVSHRLVTDECIGSRHVKDWGICTVRASFIGILNRTMSF
jgi:serine/threonine protein kinase